MKTTAGSGLANLDGQALSRLITPSFNLLRVAAAVLETETVTIGTYVFEVDTNASYTAGRYPIDLSAAATPAYATGTLTSNGTNVTDGDTCTIGSTVYRFKATMAAAYDVQRGADAATTLANLKKAINATGTAGTEYFAGTLIHPTVTAGAITSTTLVVTAKTKGTGGNAIASTETAVTLSWGAATLASGADATATEFVDAFVIALNAAGIGWRATEMAGNYVFVEQANITGVDASTAFTETLSGSNNAWASATALVGNGPATASKEMVMVYRTPTAAEVTAENMAFPFSFNPVAAAVFVRTSAGVQRAHDGAVTISGNKVLVGSGGSTDVTTNDVVTVIAC